MYGKLVGARCIVLPPSKDYGIMSKTRCGKGWYISEDIMQSYMSSTATTCPKMSQGVLDTWDVLG